MEHTENYQLSLWEQDDRIMREDFNADNAKIDAALSGISPIIGTYTGDGKTTEQGGQTIHLGFRPRFVFATSGWNTSTQAFVRSMLMLPGVPCDFYQLNDDGFTVYENADNSHVQINFINLPYVFIAFP